MFSLTPHPPPPHFSYFLHLNYSKMCRKGERVGGGLGWGVGGWGGGNCLSLTQFEKFLIFLVGVTVRFTFKSHLQYTCISSYANNLFKGPSHFQN
jgi:hypothetical protein